MAPRIRLNLSKPLPTIRETHEEAMEDSSSNLKRAGGTAARPDLYSSDDYIQSICHLARPTFPALPESSQKVQDRKSLKILEDGAWSPFLGETQQELSKCKLTNLMSNVAPLGKVTPAESDFWSREDPLAQIYTHTGKLCPSKASLYGKSSSTGYSQSNSSPSKCGLHPPATKEAATGKPSLPRLFSFPRLPSPRPAQKEAGCSELKYLRRDVGAVFGSNHSEKEKGPVFITSEEPSPCAARGKLVEKPVLPRSVGRQSCLFHAVGADEKEERESSHCSKIIMGDAHTKQGYSECFRAAKKATSHNWVSARRCIWKETRVKACLLPAIAEV